MNRREFYRVEAATPGAETKDGDYINVTSAKECDLRESRPNFKLNTTN